MDKSQKIDILNLHKYVYSHWLILAALMIAGGLAGYLFTTMRAPVYESSASFGVTIDYTQTGALSDVQEDQAMRGVGSILLSDALIEETLSRLNSGGSNSVNKDDFRGNASVDRGDFRWTIRYRDGDPQRAFRIVSTWSAAAQEVYEEIFTHAQTAESFLEILNDLQGCYQLAAAQSPNEYCGFNDTDELLREISGLSGKIQTEKTASRGFFYALSVVLVNGAEVRGNPVRYQTNLLVAAGAFAGLLIGMAYFSIRYYSGGRLS